MKTFKQKKDDLTQLEEQISGAKMTVFTAYAKNGEKGLTVGKLREMKLSLAKANTSYTVAKKTLVDKALKDRKVKDVDVFSFDGSLGLAFSSGDEALSAKALYSFARANPSLKLYGAVVGTDFINATRFVELAKLPAKEVMIGRALGMIQYPITGLVGALSGNIKKLLLTLRAIETTK